MSVTMLMNSKLKLALLQTELIWENPKANHVHFEQLLKFVPDDSDLIVLPEMFTTGFSMNSINLAESNNGISVGWMKNVAAIKNASVIGSIIIKDEGQYYNRLYWVFPDGTFEQYDKRHLFRMANEDKHFAQGMKRLVADYKGWKICPLICYDLRFPVWSRNDCQYDCVIYIANWPAPRVDAWSALLRARAIENQCFSIGVNRIGMDGSGIKYSGGSAAFSPRGQLLTSFQDDMEKVEILEIEKNELIDMRRKFPVHLDQDHFEVKGI